MRGGKDVVCSKCRNNEEDRERDNAVDIKQFVTERALLMNKQVCIDRAAIWRIWLLVRRQILNIFEPVCILEYEEEMVRIDIQ